MTYIVARVPKCDYPTISLVSKSFRSLVTSPELYTRRSLLGFTEHCLYVVFYNCDTKEDGLYILCWKLNSNRVVMIRLLCLMPSDRSCVVVDSKIYVLAYISALSIDCRSHTVQPIPDITKPMTNTKVAGIIDGKIYVSGRCYSDDGVSSGRERCTRVFVLDTKTQTWEPKMIKPGLELGAFRPKHAVVMEDKIYMRLYRNSFVYVPKENKWETDEMLKSKSWEGACVLHNVLYHYDTYMNKLRAYDPKRRCWRVVKGLEEFSLKTAGSRYSKTVSYGRKLALFFHKDQDASQKEILCAEITLERCQAGEIWGKVQWCDAVTDDANYRMDRCLAVTV